MAKNRKTPFALNALAHVCAFAAWAAHDLHDRLFNAMTDAGMVLGANSFSKEEIIAFEALLEGFQDALVLSRLVSVYRTDMMMMERSSDIIWRPQPYIAQSFNGTDQSANFKDSTQLSVPATIGFGKSVPWNMTAKQLRDALQEKRLGDAAHQKLASDINVSVNAVASLQGTLVVKRSTAAAGYDDFAQCEAIMNERGIATWDRFAGVSTRDYNGMASNLAARQTMAGLPQTAYADSMIGGGKIASFQAHKMDYTPRQAAAAGGAITLGAANQFYTPKSTSTAVSGETGNVDNRFQTIVVSATANVAAGDAFSLAGIDSVHHITKADTGQPMTFRVIAVQDSTHLLISPPIINAAGGTDAEKQYQNCTGTLASNAAITWLNTVAGYLNPFWQKDAIELLPARYAVPDDAGVAVLRASTDQGIEVVLQKWYDIKTMTTLYRADSLWGVVNKQPEMSGVMLFSQT